MNNEEQKEANDPAIATVVSGLGKGQLSLQCYA